MESKPLFDLEETVGRVLAEWSRLNRPEPYVNFGKRWQELGDSCVMHALAIAYNDHRAERQRREGEALRKAIGVVSGWGGGCGLVVDKSKVTPEMYEELRGNLPVKPVFDAFVRGNDHDPLWPAQEDGA